MMNRKHLTQWHLGLGNLKQWKTGFSGTTLKLPPNPANYLNQDVAK